MAEGADDFWEVGSCALGPGCFKSLSKRIACVELGSTRSSDGLILVKASKWPFLLREGWVRIPAGVPWEADGCVVIVDVHCKAELLWQSGQSHTAQISRCLHHFFATKMSYR